MYMLGAIGPDCDPTISENPHVFHALGEVNFGSVRVQFGVCRVKRPFFEPSSTHDRDYVLVKVKRFSCNYRDKAALLVNLEQHPSSVLPFGSEFVGEVVDAGSNVTELSVGDRVMPESAYPDAPASGTDPGIATNFASRGWLRLHRGKLTKVPDGMDDDTAACFTLGAQTAMGMIRRSQILQQGGCPVVLSSRSSTSLFITRFLLCHGFVPTCLTTSDWSEMEKKIIEPAVVINPSRDRSRMEAMRGCFTHVFDPFIDINLPMGVRLLTIGGVYTTCGFLNQHAELNSFSAELLGTGVQEGLRTMIVNNLRLQGNCLGSRSDLDRAVKLYNEGVDPVIVDGRFTVGSVIDFIESSFFNSGKMGKVVMEMPEDIV